MKKEKVFFIFLIAAACGSNKPLTIDLSNPGAVGPISPQLDEGGPNPPDTTITLSNNGTCPLAFTAAASMANGTGWLSVTPNTGTIAASGTSMITVKIDIVTLGLAAGNYTGTIGVSGVCTKNGKPAAGSPVLIAVNVQVKAVKSVLVSTPGSVPIEVPLIQNVWSGVSTSGQPAAARSSFTAVWTGSYLIVWGGMLNGNSLNPLNTGSRYDPQADTWTDISTLGAPAPRWSHTAVWTGSQMIVWGGYDQNNFYKDGASYDPITDTWTALPTLPIAARYGHSAVWTGNEMIVWGGYTANGEALDGARYHPATSQWTGMTSSQAPAARDGHTAVWTGWRMIVWGGSGNNGPVSTGGQYDPVTDSWSPTAISGAPAARSFHTALWTGSLMLVYGGVASPGGRYDPGSNSWKPMAAGGAPVDRSLHSAVWTGHDMVVWGGRSFGQNATPLNSGGVYTPSLDTWTSATVNTNAPDARQEHGAVWTGTQMIVWGGLGSQTLAGGLYQ